jgi:hypothetical protein
MLIRLTVAAMLTTFVAASVPTASFAASAKCQKLLRDLEETWRGRRSSDREDRMEDIVDVMEDECDDTTLLKSARMLGMMPDNLKF